MRRALQHIKHTHLVSAWLQGRGRTLSPRTGKVRYLEVERGMNVLGTVKYRAEDEKVHFLLLVRLYAVHAINMS